MLASDRVRRTFYRLRTEAPGAGREAAAIGVGVFLGCLPFYGFHLLLCWACGTIFRLNRLKVYLAANISNPLVAPWLIFAELQAGAWLRHGTFQAISPGGIRAVGVSAVGLDILVGSLVVGAVLGVLLGGATYAATRGSTIDDVFLELVRRASDRYAGASITAWEFARGKLRGDPLYRATVFGRLLPSGGTLIDLGCGQGLTLALLAEAARIVDEGAWLPSSPLPPRFERMIGVEVRPRIAGLARDALNGDAEVINGDARAAIERHARAVLLFDVLHLMDADAQEAILATLATHLDRDGVLLVRDADASGGWRFHAVRFGNRLKAAAAGAWRQPFCFRTRTEWVECFGRHGFQVEVRPMGHRTPFANLLFRLTVKPAASASMLPRAPLV